jgi:MFS family permease
LSGSGQFRLLRERRFAPFFLAQALGAFNDNLLKNVLVLAATYQTARFTHLDPKLLVNLAGGLFILPFVLFSGVAGQLADRSTRRQPPATVCPSCRSTPECQ